MKIAVLVVILVALLAMPVLASETSKDEFITNQYYNNLLSDNDFISTNAMSVDEIQSFLVSQNSFLKEYAEGGRTAARIIWDAAHANTPDSQGSLAGIQIDQSTGTVSPWVILCTLQKEQSLISSTSYSQSKLDYAMGYGTLEGGAWNAAYKGFAKQIDWASWQLRYNFHRAETSRTTLTNYKVGVF